MKNKIEKAFTLIELLVVIAIIGILAGILFVAINPKEQSDKAKAAKISHDLKEIEKAFYMTALETSGKTFPTESEFGEGDSPMINKLINSGKLKYLSKLDKIDGRDYGYDNDGDIAELDCSNPNEWYRGANIVITLNQNIIHILDEIIDDSNGVSCGKLRWSGGTTTYNLSDNK